MSSKWSPSYQREICIFGLADLPYLMKSEKYFANKFDAQKDDLILQCLEELISVWGKYKPNFIIACFCIV